MGLEKTPEECGVCVLQESPVVHIESNGRCNICNSAKTFEWIYRKPDESILAETIEKIRVEGQKSEFDCIVGLSGGRDSTGLLYELVKSHKLRCVAMFFKTPFTPPEIVENVHRMARHLNFRLLERETPENHLSIAAYCMKQYSKNKNPVMANLACSPCKYINLEVLKQAKSMNIRNVIFGGNPYEYIPLSPGGIYIKSSDRFSGLSMLKDFVLRIGKGIIIVAKAPKLLRYLPVFFMASVFYVNFYTLYLRLRYPKIRRIDYYLYTEWKEDRINQILEELKWKLPEGCNSTWRADCAFEAVKNRVFRDKLGFTYAHALYSNLIRAKQMTREDAKRRIEKETISEKRLTGVLKLCGLSEEIFT